MTTAILSRRSVLRCSAFETATLALAAAVPGCATSTRSRNGVASASHAGALPEPWASILEIARRTPSPHNTQPWKLRAIDGQRVRIFMDNARLLPKEDTTGSFITSAMGMFVEVFRMAAANLGIAVEFHADVRPIEDGLIPFGWFERTPGRAVAAEFSNAVLQTRATSRLPLQNHAVPTRVVECLRAIAARAGHEFKVIVDPSTIKQLINLNVRTLVEDMNSRDYHDEIVHWFRYDEATASKTQDGLSARCMALSPGEFRFFANHPSVANVPILGAHVRNSFRDSLIPTTQVGVLSGRFFENPAAFDTGRMFIQMWLTMARENVFLLPFGNLVTNLTARKQTMALTQTRAPWIVFRFGYSDIPPHSHRLDTRRLFV